MARTIHRLTDRECEKRRVKRGRAADGGGLYLSFTATGAKSWTFVWQEGGRFREMGLGSYPAITLKRAREIAHDLRQAVANGRDPIADRRSGEGQTRTFGEVADAFVESMAAGWSNPKHIAQWRMTLGDVYCKSLRGRPVGEVATDDVLKVLNPVWQAKPETAARLRGRIERVLDHAKAKGWRDSENPARWRGHLDHILPAPKKLTKRGHHAAMPYADVPGFLASLRERPGLAARALELTILTAARSGEVLSAEWSEFDLEAAVWTVPAERMKARKVHRVPLSPRAVDILNGLRAQELSDRYVFPGQKAKRPLSNMAMSAVLKRMKRDSVTVHGFRSAFRDWAAEETEFARELAEAALAHVVGDATERAYRRGDALARRRKLMGSWEDFLEVQL